VPYLRASTVKNNSCGNRYVYVLYTANSIGLYISHKMAISGLQGLSSQENIEAEKEEDII